MVARTEQRAFYANPPDAVSPKTIGYTNSDNASHNKKEKVQISVRLDSSIT